MSAGADGERSAEHLREARRETAHDLIPGPALRTEGDVGEVVLPAVAMALAEG